MFDILKQEIKNIINNIGNRPLFETNADKEKIKDMYLTILNDGEPILKENPTYTCDACLSFLNKFGSIIWYEDGIFVSIWDKINLNKFNGKFLRAIEQIKQYIGNHKEPTEYKFFENRKIGIEKNTGIKDFGNGRVETLTFTHLYGVVEQINTIKSGGFTKYYRLNEAKELVEKAKEINLFIKNDTANILIEAVPMLRQYESSLNKVKEVALSNPYETHISRDTKLSNLLFTCMLKTKEDSIEKVIEFAKVQTRADRFMQEKAKDDATLMKQYSELQKNDFVFTGLEEVEPTYVFPNNAAVEKTAKAIGLKTISKEQFINILNNTPVGSLSLLINEKDIDTREAAALKQRTGETPILKQPIITVYKTGYAGALWDTVKKHGGNIDAKFVFSLIFGQPCYNEPIIGRDIPDLDLHCITPNNHIYYGNKGIMLDGLLLDVDMKVSEDSIIDPIENIYGDNPEDGKYLFYVEDFTSPGKRGEHLNNFKFIAKIDGEEHETEVVDMNIKWFIHLKNSSMNAKDLIRNTFKAIPVKTIIDADDQILFDIGLDETFKTTGINKEYLLHEYQRYNQVIKMLADEIDAKAMIGYKNHESFIIELNGNNYIVKG